MKSVKKMFLLILLSFCLTVPLCLLQLTNYFLTICTEDTENGDFATYSIQHESNPLTMNIQYFKDLYDQLISNQSNNYVYYEIYLQYLENTKETSQFFCVETDELMDSCYAIKCAQINENIIRDCNIFLSYGELFNQDDYKYEKDAIIPILLGSDYSALYNLGDEFYFNYLFDEYTFKVIGFLTKGSNIELGVKHILLDKYIIMPSFELEDNVPITKGLKIHYANKISGIVKLDIDNVKYFHLYIEPLYSSSNVGEYSWTARPMKLQFKEFFGIDLIVFLILMIAICFIFIFFIGLIIYKFLNLAWENNRRKNLNNSLLAIIIFILTSTFYCFINRIYSIILGITVIKGIHFLIIGGVSIAIITIKRWKT